MERRNSRLSLEEQACISDANRGNSVGKLMLDYQATVVEALKIAHELENFSIERPWVTYFTTKYGTQRIRLEIR